VNHVFVADQLASFSFAAFLILSATFYGWVAVPLPRAIKVHRMNVGAYFVATGLAYYLIHFTHGKGAHFSVGIPDAWQFGADAAMGRDWTDWMKSNCRTQLRSKSVTSGVR
jgi:hypothetical protein